MFTHCRKLLACTALLMLITGCAGAPTAAEPVQNNSRPSEESIRTLLEVAEVQKIVDGIKGQTDTMMKAAFQSGLKGQTLTPDQQKICDEALAKMEDLVRQELSWDVLEPMYIRIYSDSLTQTEVDEITAFYRTPGGQAYIKKLPLLSQNILKELQVRMGPMHDKIHKITEDAVAELKADAANKAPRPEKPAAK